MLLNTKRPLDVENSITVWPLAVCVWKRTTVTVIPATVLPKRVMVRLPPASASRRMTAIEPAAFGNTGTAVGRKVLLHVPLAGEKQSELTPSYLLPV